MQEGQPCSYCIAVFTMMSDGEALSVKDELSYSRHLIWDHKMRPFKIEP